MPIVKIDRKGRIQLPNQVRKEWRLKPRQALLVSIGHDELSVRKPSKATADTDPLLHDILKNPLKTKKRVTKQMLDKIEDEMWLP